VLILQNGNSYLTELNKYVTLVCDTN